MFNWEDVELEHVLDGERNARAALCTYMRTESLMHLRSVPSDAIPSALGPQSQYREHAEDESALLSLAPELVSKIVVAACSGKAENAKDLRLVNKQLCLTVNRALRECIVNSRYLQEMVEQQQQQQQRSVGWAGFLTSHFPSPSKSSYSNAALGAALQSLVTLTGVKYLRVQSVGSDTKFGAAARTFLSRFGCRLPNVEEIDMFCHYAFLGGMLLEDVVILVKQFPQLRNLAAPASGAALQALVPLQSLQTLVLDKGTGVSRSTDGDMHVLSTMTQLRALSFNCRLMSGNGFACLSSLQGLSSLAAHDVHADISDQSLACISKLRCLADLLVGGTRPGSISQGCRAVAAYASLPRLRSLTLVGSIDASIADLRGDVSMAGRFPCLRKLVLQNTEVGPEQLHVFFPEPERLSNPLEELDLLCCQLQPWQQCIESLYVLSNLKILKLPSVPSLPHKVESYFETLPANVRYQLKQLHAKSLLQVYLPLFGLKRLKNLQQLVFSEVDRRLFLKLKEHLPVLAYGCSSVH